MSTGAAHLARLGGAARPAGSAAAADAQAYCASVLAPLGFDVSELSFEFSKLNGAWGAPIAGLLLAGASSLIYALRGHGALPYLVLSAGLMALSVTLAQAGSRVLRARATNLQAVRGAPSVWLVAHIDSKWQPVSMITRVIGAIGSGIAMLGFLLFDFARLDGAGWWLIAVWVFAIPLLLSVVGFRNHGTLDNASGVATVLEAVEQLPRDVPLGVLITDGEELALVGAAAWSGGRAPGIALNVDSVDDDGPLVAMHSGSSSTALASELRRAASADGETLRVIRLIPGILTDHVVLHKVGWETLTLSRGTLRTLKRIHTSRDTLGHMDGRGIAGAARVVARTVTELI